MKILDVELGDFDFNDADNLEKFEKEAKLTEKKINAMDPKGKTASEVIREGCNIIFDCFNNIFGKGTAQKVFGNKTSLKVCMEAFKDLIAERNKQDKEIDAAINEIGKEYSPNRATRRAKK